MIKAPCSKTVNLPLLIYNERRTEQNRRNEHGFSSFTKGKEQLDLIFYKNF